MELVDTLFLLIHLSQAFFLYFYLMYFIQGPVRFHAASKPFDKALYASYKDGIDLIEDPAVIQQVVPGITKTAKCLMHVRKVRQTNMRVL
jgi:hypothetical protein